jgi:hypothetical protein
MLKYTRECTTTIATESTHATVIVAFKLKARIKLVRCSNPGVCWKRGSLVMFSTVGARTNMVFCLGAARARPPWGRNPSPEQTG